MIQAASRHQAGRNHPLLDAINKCLSDDDAPQQLLGEDAVAAFDDLVEIRALLADDAPGTAYTLALMLRAVLEEQGSDVQAWCDAVRRSQLHDDG
jgi:hypothetical protein